MTDIAVINLAGLPGSGKTTLISRLLGKKFEHDRPSTGICNTTVAVDVDFQSAQSHTVVLGDDFIWEDFGHSIHFKISCVSIFFTGNVPESD